MLSDAQAAPAVTHHRPPSREAPTRRLRVAMVHLSDFHFDSRIQRQAMALAERGDTVELICLGRRDEVRVGDGVIRVHPIEGDKAAGGARAYLLGYGRFLAAATRRLTELELRHGFDLIEVHNMPDVLTLAAIVPRLRGVPVILNLHDTFPELFASKFERPANDRLVRLVEIEERFSARLADRLVTVTDQAAERLASRGVGVGRTTVVMNSPDEGVFGPSRPPVAIPASGPIRVLYHGGSAQRFGIETLIRAFEHLPPAASRVTLRVCGAVEDRGRLTALAASIASDRIEVLGQVPFAAIPRELEAAHIGVVPTLHDQFTELLLPVKLLEYVHMGLAGIASRLPGITSYFSDREVRLFEPGQPERLAEAITELCEEPAGARQRAALAAERLVEIRWEAQRQRYLALVDELTSRRARRRRA